MKPGRIVTPPKKPFLFMCQAPDGSRPRLVFAKTGKPVDEDPRFSVTYLSQNLIQVYVEKGLDMNSGELTIE